MNPIIQTKLRGEELLSPSRDTPIKKSTTSNNQQYVMTRKRHMLSSTFKWGPLPTLG